MGTWSWSSPSREAAATWWRDFAELQCRGYSPLYEEICQTVAGDEVVLDLVVEAPFAGRQPNVLLAAVHLLLLQGLDHPLADVYAGRSNAAPGPLFCEIVHTHRDDLARLLATKRTNTNECGRTAVLAPSLRWVADRLGEPLALLDAGTSAGLNLDLDRYLLRYDTGAYTGPLDSTVVVDCAVSGGPPLAPEIPEIAGRVGLDRAPVDLADPEQSLWLLACVWPDTGRLDRTRAAIALAVARPPRLIAGDMVDDLRSTADLLPSDVPLCVLTTWALAYVPTAGRERFVDELRSLGRDRPVAWISAEGPGVVTGLPVPPDRTPDGIEPSVVGCQIFDGSREEAHLLGRCHPHGNWLEWMADAEP